MILAQIIKNILSSIIESPDYSMPSFGVPLNLPFITFYLHTLWLIEAVSTSVEDFFKQPSLTRIWYLFSFIQISLSEVKKNIIHVPKNWIGSELACFNHKNLPYCSRGTLSTSDYTGWKHSSWKRIIICIDLRTIFQILLISAISWIWQDRSYPDIADILISVKCIFVFRIYVYLWRCVWRRERLGSLFLW